MKRSLLTGSLIVMSLVQGLSAHAQLMDLPDPGGDTGQTTPSTPSNTPDVQPSQPQTQYAGSLRVSSMSRKTGGTLYKIDLAESTRLQRLDVRVAESKLKIYSTQLVTESGYKVTVNQLSNTGVLETSSVVASENFSLNERIKTIEILAEAYSGEADIILTAVADSGVPKLSLRQEAPPVIVDNTPSTPSITPIQPDNSGNNSGGSIIYYGTRFRAGERVLYAGTTVASVVGYDRYEMVQIVSDGYYQTVYPEDLSRAVRCSQNNICKGDRVTVGRSSQVYTVNEVFENGMASIAHPQSYYPMFTDASTLTKFQGGGSQPAIRSLQCTSDRRYCLGDRVTHPDGYVVTISAIYSNGTAIVTDAAGSETVRISSLRPVRGSRW